MSRWSVPVDGQWLDIVWRRDTRRGDSAWYLVYLGDRLIGEIVGDRRHRWTAVSRVSQYETSGPTLVEGFADRLAATEYLLQIQGYRNRPNEPAIPVGHDLVVSAITARLGTFVGDGGGIAVREDGAVVYRERDIDWDDPPRLHLVEHVITVTTTPVGVGSGPGLVDTDCTDLNGDAA